MYQQQSLWVLFGTKAFLNSFHNNHDCAILCYVSPANSSVSSHHIMTVFFFFSTAFSVYRTPIGQPFLLLLLLCPIHLHIYHFYILFILSIALSMDLCVILFSNIFANFCVSHLYMHHSQYITFIISSILARYFLCLHFY